MESMAAVFRTCIAIVANADLYHIRAFQLAIIVFVLNNCLTKYPDMCFFRYY